MWANGVIVQRYGVIVQRARGVIDFSSKLRCDHATHRNGSVPGAFIDVSTVAAANDLETYVIIGANELIYATSLNPPVRSSYSARRTITDANRGVRVVTSAELLYISETRVNEGGKPHGRRRKTKGCSFAITDDCAHRTEPIFHGAKYNLVD